MINKFEGQIGNELLDTYERSTLFRRVSEKNNQVRLKRDNSKALSRYLNTTNFSEKQEYELAFEHLEREGYIRTNRIESQICEVLLVLDEESINRLYEYLKRENPHLYLTEINAVAEKYSDREDMVGEFCCYLIQCSQNQDFKKAKRYVQSVEEFELVITFLEAILSLKQTMRERDFSQKIFGDTKTLSNNRNLFERIIRDFSGESFEDGDDILKSYGISKNKMYAFVKHGLVVKIHRQTINLDDYDEELPLSDSAIETMSIICCTAKVVMTVENLTTFYEINEPDICFIYLGGYHNSIKQSLITKIAETCPNLKFYHFGDIDPDGFQILKALREKTGIDFKPYLMEKATLRKYIAYTKTVNTHDLALLDRELLNPAYKDVLECLLEIKETKKKLEQETIYAQKEI